MRRRTLMTAMTSLPFLAPVVGSMASGLASTASAPEAVPAGPLEFDPAAYTAASKTVTTAAGDVVVEYHLYEAIPYVANPVDVAYQSLNVLVPVAVNGTVIDAAGAPMLFSNSVGGYMSSPVSGGGMGPEPGSDRSAASPTADAAGPDDATPAGVPSGSAEMIGNGQRVSNADLALAAGYVVVAPGARGRDNVAADGTYYGKAPAAIVDLKAAARYVRANRGRIPGNTDWLIASGTSAGGALATLLGASADAAGYEPYLTELGAAAASDAMFAVAAYCPITDLEHADMAYEWMFGAQPWRETGTAVDSAVSGALSAAFADYLAGLELAGPAAFGPLTVDTYGDYVIQSFLAPAAATYLTGLDDGARAEYLAANSWLTWAEGAASFTLADFQAHVGRSKGLPAFDAFDLSAGENSLFGTETLAARHFTEFSLRQASGDAQATLDSDLPPIIALMNPMAFILPGEDANPDRAKHWWFRVGTSDTDTSLAIVGNLHAALTGLGDNVNTRMYWDAGHGANEDAPALITWIAEITGYSAGQ